MGATLLLFPSIPKSQPAKVLEELKKYGATSLGGSPAFAHKLACHVSELRTNLPLSTCNLGGAPVYRGILRTIVSVTPGKKVLVVYGSTEAEPVSAIFAEEKMELEAGKPDGHCVGRAVFDGSARVIGILSGRFIRSGRGHFVC